MFKPKNLPLTISTVVVISLIIGWGISMVLAWQDPTAIPPSGNVSAPINVSSTEQTKAGIFGADGGFKVDGTTAVAASNRLHYTNTGGSWNTGFGSSADGVFGVNPRSDADPNDFDFEVTETEATVHGNFNVDEILTVSGTGDSSFAGNILMNNKNINNVNWLRIGDPGEGIDFSSGIQMYVIDDATDNIFTAAGNTTNQLYLRLNNAGTGDFDLDVNGDADISGDLTVSGTISGTISGTTAEAFALDIEDTRTAERLPNEMPDRQVTAEFTDEIVSGWHSLINIKGWSDGYASWQLLGGSTTSTHENLYFRSGINAAWNLTRKIWHEGSDGSGSGLDADLLDNQNGSYYLDNTDTQNLSYTASTDVISLTNGGSIDITEVNTTVDGCTDCLNATEISDIYVLNTSDTMSGNLTVGGDITVSGNQIYISASSGRPELSSNTSGFRLDALNNGEWDFLVYEGLSYMGDLRLGYNDTATITTYDTNENLIIDPAGTGTVTIVGKLTVGTIDPVYEIDGIEYATYVADFAGGVRTETSGVIKLDSENKYVIDFEDLETGSDLWLFWETSTKEMDELVVILTPGFVGDVGYKKEGNRLIIYGDPSTKLGASEPEEVSYRLTLPREDDEEWGNLVVPDK